MSKVAVLTNTPTILIKEMMLMALTDFFEKR